MSEPRRDETYVPDDVEKHSDTGAGNARSSKAAVGDDRGGFRDTAPNPHDEDGAAKTAAQTTGAMMLAGGMLPAVILTIIAAVVILYFLLR